MWWNPCQKKKHEQFRFCFDRTRVSVTICCCLRVAPNSFKKVFLAQKIRDTYLFFFGYQTVKTRSKPELHILARHLKFGWSLQTDTTTIWVFGQMPDLKKLILAGHGSFLKLALTNTDKWPIISHYKYVKPWQWHSLFKNSFFTKYQLIIIITRYF